MNALFQFNGSILKAETTLEDALIKLHDPEVMQRSGYHAGERLIESAISDLRSIRAQVTGFCAQEVRE